VPRSCTASGSSKCRQRLDDADLVKEIVIDDAT
jgi:hypothetical protein